MSVPGDDDAPRYLELVATLDAVLRLARLPDTPDDVPVLAPLALREIHRRVLSGEPDARLRQPCEVDGPSQRVARAIELPSDAMPTRFASKNSPPRRT